jgi:methylthioribose-1-phosphate isomerase
MNADEKRSVEVKQMPSKYSFETIRWTVDHLEMIDQRVLPGQVSYLPYRSGAEVAQGIRDMVVRGAPAIGCAAAYGVALEALRVADQSMEQFEAALQRAEEILSNSRPTAVNLAFAIEWMRQIRMRHPLPPKAQAEQMLQAAHRFAAEDTAANRRMGAFGAEMLADGDRVLTHCNAGALAAVVHGTALGVIRSAVAAGKRISVIADETRPFLQGARLTAWELQQDNIPVTLITDNMAGHLMALGEIDAVVVGADRVAANGDVANKIGTYMVAVLARRHGIPFYVACPLATIDRSIATGAEIPIEERSADEVTGYFGQRWAPEGIAVRNPAFDVTPAELITAIVTEEGLIRPPDQQTVSAIFGLRDARYASSSN